MKPEKFNEHIVFVLGSFTMGGIQSNIIKMIPRLIEKDFDVSILLITDKIDGSFEKLLEGVNIIYFKNIIRFESLALINSSALLHSIPPNINKTKKKLSSATLLHSVCSESMIVAHRISRILDIPFSTGCYHPREYTWSASGFYFRTYQKKFFGHVSENNRMFFNEESFLATVSKYPIKTKYILPIITSVNPIRNKGKVCTDRIISVGRLVSFKSYNLHMINSVDEINSKHGLELEYHIYGDGPERELLESIASTKKSKIVFHGTLPYSDFYKTVSSSLLFLGCGSALLEAASTGVPCMYGVDSIRSPRTYGYFHSVPGFNLGELDSKLNLQSYEEFFEMFLDDISRDLYSEIGIKEYHKAKNNGSDVIIDEWVDFFRANENSVAFYLDNNKFQSVLYFLSNFIWLALNFMGIRRDRKNRY